MKNRYNKSTEGVHRSMNNLFDNPRVPISIINSTKKSNGYSNNNKLNAQTLKAIQNMDKRNSILMPSLQLIVDKNQRRSSFNGLSRNDIIQNLISISTKESSNVSQNQKPFGEDKNNGGLLISKLFSVLCKDTHPESVNPYKIFITPAQDFRDSLDYKYSRIL